MNASLLSLQLEKDGLSIWPNFLTDASWKSVREDLDEIQEGGGFHRATTGKMQTVNETRRDETHWLTRETANAPQNKLWSKLDFLKRTFNRKLFMGISSFEGHYAAYPQGGFYQRHLDCFREDDARIVSFVLYLNQNWKSSDGGRLRIYNENSHTDVDPVGGTMACFLSREKEHEVMESHANRFSFTGWFKTREPGRRGRAPGETVAY